MNPNYGKSRSLNSFDFDLGLNSGSPRPLNDQKSQTSSYSSSMQSKPNSTNFWSQPNKPTWTPHQGVGSLSGPASMVGDILGKSWVSSGPSSTSSAASLGIPNKNPNLFGDLVSSAFGQNKSSSSDVPLKNATPTANKSAYSMGDISDTLQKIGNLAKSGGSWGSAVNSGGYNANNLSGNVNLSGAANKNPNLGGTSMKSMSGGGVGKGMGVNNDPFGSLVDFTSKLRPNYSGNKTSNKHSSEDEMFGDFQNASKSSRSAFPAGNSNASTESNSGTSAPTQSSGFNEFDSLFSTTTASSKGAAGGSEKQHDDWGFDSEFVGANDNSGTPELEGLPPPPAGVSALAAKIKGMDSHKHGQYADAIKWLSWAVILLEKSGDEAGVTEVLSIRASCYKEVGEYKKAVADCSKVLERQDRNVCVLVQRALLYESMEKYKLGAEDLRTVMRIDPGNRVARSTIHRLLKMAE